MQNYQFQLAKWSDRDKSLRCPSCGKTGYKVYVDSSGRDIDPINHSCGKCDHENSCGYHLSPKEFFQHNPDRNMVAEHSLPSVNQQKQRIEINRDLVFSSAKCYDRNILVRWIKSLPIDDERKKYIDGILGMYFIGTTKDGGTIFWQMDSDGVVRTGKKILYTENGHRKKDSEGNSVGFNWCHAMLKPCPRVRKPCVECANRSRCPFPEDRYNLVQCLFGESLIKLLPKATVHVVESEKTALLMSIFDRDAFKKNIWLACGGKNNLRQVLQAPLSGRNVVIYPDKDSFSGKHNWPDAVSELGIKCVISDAAVRMSTEEDGDKCDIADIAVRRLRESESDTLEIMQRQNENVKALISKLDLKKI